MSFVQKMRNRAQALQRHLVLPEGSEERTMRAAERILAEGIAARVSLVGEPERAAAAGGADRCEVVGH